ncbi:MAG TPA: hypothetical protein VG738_12980 [Chitinophagaceae bacterium]|nr:hypothetical protein [Chitinophagaceae bacterium]
MNNYLLLRNNKETGPFSFDELVKQGLKQYDLIWVEGKSAAWRYPCEITELKQFAPEVTEQPFDRFFKKQDKNGTVVNNNTGAAIQEPPVIARPKPRIRIKAEWNKIDTPQVAAVIAKEPVAEQKPRVQQPAKNETPSWKSSWLDWSEEQTAVKAASKKTAMVNMQNTQPQAEEPVLETKFSQSLNEIKEKYAATILKAKTKAGEWQRFKPVAIIVMLSIPVMCFGVWLGHKWTAKDEAGQVVYAKTTPPATPQVNSQTTANDDVKDNNAVPEAPQKAANDGKEMIPFSDDGNKNAAAASSEKAQVKKPVVQNDYQHKKLPVQQAYASVRNNTVIAKKQTSTQPTAAANTGEPQRKYAFTEPSGTNPGARTKTINPVVLSNPGNNADNSNDKKRNTEQPVARKNTEEANPVFRHTGNEAKIEDFVNVDADQPYTQNVQNLKLNVQNVADIPLDLVVIDVEYFDAADRFKNGQTIHIKNIPAGEAINVKVPDNLAATKIKYKVSLVSAEQKGVYLIGE